jgi:hypothetical protein
MMKSTSLPSSSWHHAAHREEASRAALQHGRDVLGALRSVTVAVGARRSGEKFDRVGARLAQVGLAWTRRPVSGDWSRSGSTPPIEGGALNDLLALAHVEIPTLWRS